MLFLLELLIEAVVDGRIDSSWLGISAGMVECLSISLFEMVSYCCDCWKMMIIEMQSKVQTKRSSENIKDICDMIAAVS